MKNLAKYIKENERSIIPLDFLRRFSISKNEWITLQIRDFPKGDYNLFSFNYGLISISQEDLKKDNNLTKYQKEWYNRMKRFGKLASEDTFLTYIQEKECDFAPIPKSGLLHLISVDNLYRLDDVLRKIDLKPKDSIYYTRLFDENKRLYMINTED